MADVTDEVAAFMPPGTANPIAGIYAHLILGEDMFLHMILKKTEQLSESSWKDKTGFSSPHPMEWQTEYPKWLKTVKMDTQKAKEYASAVFQATEKYVANLTDEDLEKEVDMTAFGWGNMKQGEFLSNLITGHTASITGEIAVLKGLQGLKGYPF
jgi:hypothetical protein